MPYIITVAIILVLSYFLPRYDLLRYQALVENCCRADTHSDIVNHIITINRFLPDRYKIWTHETAIFQDFYMDYRAWLSDLYIKRSLSNALTYYHSIFSFSNRKRWNTKALTDILQGALKEGMFLLETLDYYFYLREKDGITGEAPLYSCGAAPEQDSLTGIGQVAYKIHLAALTARHTAGYHNDELIASTQALLDRSSLSPCS